MPRPRPRGAQHGPPPSVRALATAHDPARCEPGRSGPCFDCFAPVATARLRRVFASRFGPDVADDLTAEVLEHAWANWPTVRAAGNPLGLLYRVGCSKARRYTRWRRSVRFPVEAVRPPESNVDVFHALRRLSHDQRVAVLAVHGFGWSYADVAEILDTTPANVANHVHRGLARLRRHLT